MARNLLPEHLEVITQTVTPGGRLLNFWPLSGGISAAMIVLEMEEPGGRPRKVVVRQHLHDELARNIQALKNECRLLAILGEARLAVPGVVALETSSEALPGPYLALDYVEGQIDLAPADLESTLRQAAGQLAAVHRVDTAGLEFLPVLGDACSEVARGHRAGTVASLDDRPIRRALEAFGRPASDNTAALLHGDYWPGNLLWRDGRLAAVIDWEDAVLGDPLYDLAIARLDLAWIFSPEAMASFTAHYQSLRNIDLRALPYWDLCAALRLARLVGDDLDGWLAFFAPYGRDDIGEAWFRVTVQRFVDQALDAQTEG